MQDGRGAGILLAVSSLDGPYGIGCFGEAARRWVDFLALAGQKYWQILPLGPTGPGDSPYQSPSAFAISPYYIDLDTLVREGLLEAAEISAVFWGPEGGRTGYAALYAGREPLLRRAFARWRGGAGAPGGADEAEYRRFLAENPWLSGYALFMAIKGQAGGRSWLEWEEGIRLRDGAALERAGRELADDIAFQGFVQFEAFRQWQALKDYARDRGIGIIGDMPIYVAMDSADIWANPELFQLDADRRPLRVAGCPPDPFAETGQLWGNPLYDWDVLAARNFAWWIARLRAALSLFDVVRIDHFRGLESYFSIDAAALDARDGRWVKGPGTAFTGAVRKAFAGTAAADTAGPAIIAEDLGRLTGEVRALLAASGFPGMKVLQFAFDSREPDAPGYMPHNYPVNCVVYTGTHDNDTAQGWFSTARPEDAQRARDYFGLGPDSSGGALAFIRGALASVARLAIIPMQDWLGLDSRARMNTPSTLGGTNWQWRMESGAPDRALAARIRRLTEITGRA